MLVFQASLRGPKRAIEIDGEHFLPLGKWEFFHGMDDLDAGNFAVSSFSCVHAFVHRGLVAHVHRDTHGRRSQRLFRAAALAASFFRSAITAFLGEAVRELVVDAARGAE